MWQAYPELQKDLTKVIQHMDSLIKVRDKKVERIIKNKIHSEGKLLRPAYSLLCANIGKEKDQEKSIAIAAAVETLHTATLIHDDVIDHSSTRHGNPTLHSVYDNKFAIYAGDYLFCIFFTILSRHLSTPSNLTLTSLSLEKIVGGELSQLHSRYQVDTTVKKYLATISGKTAKLFAISCFMGATVSKASKRQALIAWNLGHYIGMAFQILDDILDYTSTSSSIGKPVMTDIQQGIYTLPLLYTIERNPKRIKHILENKDSLSPNDLLEVHHLIKQAQGIEKAQDIARKYTKKALNQVDKLPEGAYKDTLKAITVQLLQRKF